MTDVQARFWAKVDKTGDCWLWTASKHTYGYGQFSMGHRGSPPKRAHRLSYEWANGPIPAGIEIDHSCRTRHCVKPDHLRVATRKENMENRVGPQANNLGSGIRGVYWSRQKQKWQAKVVHNSKQYHAGYFQSMRDAEAAAIELRNRLFTHNDADREAS